MDDADAEWDDISLAVRCSGELVTWDDWIAAGYPEDLTR